MSIGREKQFSINADAPGELKVCKFGHLQTRGEVSKNAPTSFMGAARAERSMFVIIFDSIYFIRHNELSVPLFRAQAFSPFLFVPL